MEQTINANDLHPGDRVVLRMPKARLGPIPIHATFERYHNAESLTAKMLEPGTETIPGMWDKALRSGRRLAAFRISVVVGVFQIGPDGRLWDEEDREVELLRREGQ